MPSSDLTPSPSPPGYGEGTAYWDARYKNDEKPFEWLEGFKELKKILLDVTDGDLERKVLNIGCGTSLISEEMYDFGWKHMVNVDNSTIAIEQMLDRNKDDKRPGMKWLVGDALAMDFSEDGKFDLVIDKSVLDTFCCADGSGRTVVTYLKEVQRVLNEEGVFLCISYGEPSKREYHFGNDHLTFELQTMRLPSRLGEEKGSHYAYIGRKRRKLEPTAGKLEPAAGTL